MLDVKTPIAAELSLAWANEAAARALAQPSGVPCASVYLSFRAAQGRRVDNARRLGAALARASEGLCVEGLSRLELDAGLARLAGLEHDLGLLSRLPPGVGLFLGPSFAGALKLAAPPRDATVVADYFALRELLRQVDVARDEDDDWSLLPERPHPIALGLDRVLAAGVRGEVRELFVRDGAVIPGRLELETGRIVAANGRDGDVLDALAACVLRSGGQVRVRPAHKMPGPVNVAAVLA